MRPHPKRNEGAAMLMVLLVILMATATAMFAIHATSFEVRASGHVRQLVQTQYVGEGGVMAALSFVDRIGPRSMQSLMRQRLLMRGGLPAIDLTHNGEPPMLVNKDGYRFSGAELQAITGLEPVDREGLGGQRQQYTPMLLVDVYDNYIWSHVMAGERADGQGQMRYMRATYTARGRTRVFGDHTVDEAGRQFHEGASDARAHGVTGPYGGGG
jgi:hypothetical protein